jgi:hypothetical protein
VHALINYAQAGIVYIVFTIQIPVPPSIYCSHKCSISGRLELDDKAVLYFSIILFVDIYSKFHSSKLKYKLKIFIQFFTLRHLSAVIWPSSGKYLFTHTQIFLLFSPTLANVYILGEGHMCY